MLHWISDFVGQSLIIMMFRNRRWVGIPVIVLISFQLFAQENVTVTSIEV
jgi:hypothetical protein